MLATLCTLVLTAPALAQRSQDAQDLQARWATPSTDSVTLEQLVAASSRLLDQRVYTAVLSAARNTGASRAVRFAALRVLAAFVNNSTLINPDDLAKPNPDTTVIAQFSTISGGVAQRIGSQPLATNVPNDIRALFAALSVTDVDPTVRRACRSLRDWFSRH